MNSTLTDDTVPVLPHVVYADELRIHAVTLIWMGHQRLDASSFATAEEDVITGELVTAMKQAQADNASPLWADHYEIHEQAPQNVGGKQGKRRPKMDIEFECRRRGSPPRLGFEAKRLGRGSGVSDYLGGEGMAAFLSGHYPTTHGEAGMLGYVQEQSPAELSSRLATELKRNSTKHSVATDGEWKSIEVNPAAAWSNSCHTVSGGKSLGVIHVLLPFT